ncbi:hypothetical protein [Nostoc sp.]
MVQTVKIWFKITLNYKFIVVAIAKGASVLRLKSAIAGVETLIRSNQ